VVVALLPPSVDVLGMSLADASWKPRNTIAHVIVAITPSIVLFFMTPSPSRPIPIPASAEARPGATPGRKAARR
jgi:hypothetical protein